MKTQSSNKALAGHPLETESNLNYEQDHQESPIDLINETTKMKHLNTDEFKSFAVEQPMSNLFSGQSSIAASSDQVNQWDQPVTSLTTTRSDLLQPLLCLRCSQRQRVMQ
jgi:hypothetical protein